MEKAATEICSLERWNRLCRRLDLSADAATYADLIKVHSQSHRAYHTLDHIAACLNHLDQLRELTDRPDEIEMALWFHDAIYDPAAEHNERKSANYFLSQLNGYFWDDFSREVERLILVTDPSTKHLGTPREGLMVDLDLSILGSSPEAYLDYSKAVRKEYSFAADEDFNRGRSQILQSILKGKIFVTEHFTHLEEQARTNITEELERLGAEN